VTPRAAAALLAALALAGCAEVGGGDEEEGYHPATVEEVPGSDVARVTLTEDAARRIALETEPVGGASGRASVPYAALVYDGDGAAWVYVEEDPLSFVRHAVDVRRVDGDRVLVGDALAGTERVATTGATELYGAERGIDGSH
jgi:hypothetical protein